MNEGFRKKYSSMDEIEGNEPENDNFKNKIKTLESKESKKVIIISGH